MQDGSEAPEQRQGIPNMVLSKSSEPLEVALLNEPFDVALPHVELTVLRQSDCPG